MQHKGRGTGVRTTMGGEEQMFDLPPLSAQQLDLLIRGVEALGSCNFGGWDEKEIEMRRLLYSIRWPEQPLGLE